jgi:hypothetical protein
MIASDGKEIWCWFCPTCETLTLLDKAKTGHCCQSPRRQDCLLPAERE